MPQIKAANIYAVWAAVGPLVGVFIGAWLSARWQRRKWILDNKTTEYRDILDALNSYRWRLVNFHALYGGVLVAAPAKIMYDDQIALAQAQEALTNAFADRIFTRQTVAQSGARNDWSDFSSKLLSDKPPRINELTKMLDSMHAKLVKVAQDDLKLHDA